MKKKSIIILIIIVVVVALSTILFVTSKSMQIPEDCKAIIDESLKTVLGIDDEKRSLASITFDNCQYSVQSTTPHRDRVEVVCHVESPDVKAVLDPLVNSEQMMNQDEFLSIFEEELSQYPPIARDVTINIVQAGDKYVAQFDEITADAFVGGLIQYTEQFVADMNEEN